MSHFYRAFCLLLLNLAAVGLPASTSPPGGMTYSPLFSTLTQRAALTGTTSTTATLYSVPNPSVYGQTADLEVALGTSGVTPTGTVTYTIDGAVQPPVALNGNYADLLTSTLSLGTHRVTAVYNGDANYASSNTSPITQIVNPHVSPQYVSLTGNDNNSGTQAAPKLTIQGAFRATSTGDTVILEDGTFTGPGNVDVDFVGKNLTVTSLHGAASTIINCQGSAASNHRGFSLSSGESSAVISGLTIENGYVSGNFNGGSGGGIYDYGVGVTIQNCIFKNNAAAHGSGGGVYNYNYVGGTTSVIDCVFIGNSASNGGGGIANSNNNGTVTVANCMLTGNSAANSGGGIANSSNNGTVTVVNCTLTGNSAAYGGGGIAEGNSQTGPYTLINDIVYGDTGGEISGASASATNCDIEGGYAGTNNINADPLFFGPPADLHLQAYSPCLGAGAASGAPSTTLDGKTRPNPPSIGAYEAAATGTAATTTTLTSSLNPSNAGQSVTFTATVAGSKGTPTGSVTFTVDGVAQVTTALSSGKASYATSSLTGGSHSVAALYSGDTNFAASRSPMLTQTVNTLSTTTALTSSLNPSTYDQRVNFTVTVTGSGMAGSGPTGLFTLTDTTTNTVLTTRGLSAGTLTVGFTGLTVGTHQIVASYAGDINYNASTSPVLVQTVNTASTTSTLTSSLNPSVAGQSVTFAAGVVFNGTTPTGSMTYTLDGTAQTPVTLSNGAASYTTSALPVGSHTITAAYSGDTNYAPSTSPALTQTVNPHISPQYVSPSGNDTNLGTQGSPKLTIQAAINVTFSGDTVIVEDGAYTGPGDVDVDFGGRNITVMSQNGAATTVINCGGASSTDGSGNHRGFYLHSGETGAVISGLTIENGYESNSGANGYSGGGIDDTGAGLILQNCILKSNTAGQGGGVYTSLNSSGTLTLINCAFTGNLSTSEGGGLYSSINSGSLTLTNCTFTGNTASGTNGAAPGGGIYTSTYPYGGYYSGSGTITLTNDILFGDTGGEVSGGSAAATNCDIGGGYAGTNNINADPLFFGPPADLHLQAYSPCLGAGAASGAPSTTLDGKTRPNPPSIGAYEAAATGTAATTTTLTSSLNPSLGGQSVTFTVTVAGTGGTPSGSVALLIDGMAQTYFTLSGSGAATYTTATLPGGSHTLTAAYGGDVKFAASKSPALTQTVQAGNTMTTLASSLNPSSYGQQITFTAAVTGSNPTGTVSFTDAATSITLGTVPLSGGTATFLTSSLTIGSHSIVASYSGDTANNAGQSPTLTQIVNKISTSTSLTSSLNPSITGQSVTFNINVAGGGGEPPPGGTPTGTVTFTVDGTAQPPVTLGGGGYPAYSTSSLSPGAHSITATYSGDTNFAPSTSPVLTQTVYSDISPQYVALTGSDSNPGTQSLPKLTIQAAINATISGNTVIVEDGTYAGFGDEDIDFVGRNITVMSQNGPAATIINCQGSANSPHRGFYLHSRETNAVINGLTIENGYESSDSGGGISISNAALTVQNCLFKDNYGLFGGGIENIDTGSQALTVTNCAFTGNAALDYGGAIYNYTTGTFSVTDCGFMNGSAGYGGGGIDTVNQSGGTFSAANCIFVGNMANSVGGGLCLDNSNNNSSGTSVVTNCTFTGNAASETSGGVYNENPGSGTITLTNDILYGDTGGEVGGVVVTIGNCDVQGGYVGTGNISSDPLFVSAPTDLHLGAGSPCLGAGTASGAPTTTIDGLTRPNPPSIGAYEGVPVATTVTVANLSGAAGQSVTLSATLTTTSGGELSGKTLAFSVDGVAAGTAVTNSAGTASLTYAIPAGANTGSHTIAVSFVGDSVGNASSGTGTLTVSAVVPVGQVRFFPRVGKEVRMVGGLFQGSSDKNSWTTLATVTQTPPANQYSTLPTSTDPATFRYLRYLAPNGSYGNVAEIEFDSHGAKLTGTGFGTAGSYNNSGNMFAKALDGSTSTYFDAPAPGNGDYVGIDRGTLTYTKLSGTAFGTAGSYKNDGNTFLNVFDGSLSTYFDAPVPNGDYAGIDLGVGHATVVTRIGYCPRSGYASRLVGGVFQGSSDNSHWTALYTVTAAPATGVLTQTTAISSGTAYRYLRYLAPNGSYGNVAEVEFDTSP